MRVPSLRIVCALAALLLLPSLTGCEMRSVTVRIADFDSNAVEGVRFWRLDEVVGSFLPGGSLLFGEPVIDRDLELVSYDVIDPEGTVMTTLTAQVIRDPANPDTVTLDLSYARGEAPGWFKISSFNAAGDSALSLEQIYL